MIAVGGAVALLHGVVPVRTFPGAPAAVAEARRWVRQVLEIETAPADIADTAVLLVSEVATNALTHTDSGHPGGRFVLRVRCGPGRLRVECDDAGSRTGSRPRYIMSGPEEVSGRGLALITELADAYGDRADPTGRTIHFELHWPVPPHASGRS